MRVRSKTGAAVFSHCDTIFPHGNIILQISAKYLSDRFPAGMVSPILFTTSAAAFLSGIKPPHQSRQGGHRVTQNFGAASASLGNHDRPIRRRPVALSVLQYRKSCRCPCLRVLRSCARRFTGQAGPARATAAGHRRRSGGPARTDAGRCRAATRNDATASPAIRHPGSEAPGTAAWRQLAPDSGAGRDLRGGCRLRRRRLVAARSSAGLEAGTRLLATAHPDGNGRANAGHCQRPADAPEPR